MLSRNSVPRNRPRIHPKMCELLHTRRRFIVRSWLRSKTEPSDSHSRSHDPISMKINFNSYIRDVETKASWLK